MSASQQGELSNLLEFQTDWKEVMQILLNSLETFPTNKTGMEKMGSEKLEEWALTQEGGDELELKVGVAISETTFLTKYLKSVRLNFNDIFKTVVMFNVTKKKVMKSLKTLAAEAVSSRLSSAEDINWLEIPRGLFGDLKTAFDDHWLVSFVDSCHKKRKAAQITSQNLKNQRDCPFCGRGNFKRLISHIMRNRDCHVKYNNCTFTE